MRNMIHRNCLSGSVNEFVAASMPGLPKRSSAAARQLEQSGWLVKVGADNTVLARQGALPAGTTVASALGSIIYNGMGQPTESGDFTFDNDCKLSRRLVEIARSGRASVAMIDPAGC